MARITGEFFLLHQDSQDFGSTGQMMVSRVYFRMAADGRPPAEYYVNVKLAVGGDYLDENQFEVGRPVGYRGPLDHQAFRQAVTRYVRACVGPGARGISFGPGAQHIRMRDNQFLIRMPFEFEAPDGEGGSW